MNNSISKGVWNWVFSIIVKRFKYCNINIVIFCCMFYEI